MAATKTKTKKTTAKKAVKKATPSSSTKKTTKKKAAPQKTAKKTVKAPPTKTATKKTAKKKAAAKTTASQKTAAKTATKATAKSNATAKTAAKATAKKAAAKKAAPTKKKSAKTIKNDNKVKTNLARMQLVGQKPPSEKTPEIPVPTHMQTSEVSMSSVNGNVEKPTPEAKAAKQSFKINDYIVYPAHGVGKITDIEKQVIAGISNELFLIVFDHEKMKLRVPTAKAQSVGMRPLSNGPTMTKALELLKGRARIKRTMWSRRAQEYEAKINSGDVLQVAEVVRDLYRADDQPEQSYSERQLFEAALDRLAREVAVVKDLSLPQAIDELDSYLKQKKAA